MKRMFWALAATAVLAGSVQADFLILRVLLNKGQQGNDPSGGGTGPFGPMGPTGPMGPFGPMGPTGPGGGLNPGQIYQGGGAATGGQSGGAYSLTADQYVSAVIETTAREWPLALSRGRYKEEVLGGSQNYAVLKHKHGFTWVNINQNEVVPDLKVFPGPARQFEERRKAIKNVNSDRLFELADWCLSVGLSEKCAAIFEEIAAMNKDKMGSAAIKQRLDAYSLIKDGLYSNLDKVEKANSWKDKIGLSNITASRHYAMLHSDIASEAEVKRRLEALEENFRTFYLWFALRGKALPLPTEKLTAVLIPDAHQFRQLRASFEASNSVTDGFHARRENIAVFSSLRLDRASVNFNEVAKPVYRRFSRQELFSGKIPDQKDKGAPVFKEWVHGNMIALVDQCLQEEAEISSATHEGTLQLFAETGLLPRNVIAPEWLRFGLASFFEMPKGPFPGGAGQVKVAFYRGSGGPSWAYMRHFEELSQQGVFNNPPSMFYATISDSLFRRAAAEARKVDNSRAAEQGDSKQQTAEQMYEVARTMSWSIVYFLAKDKYPAFEAFLKEVAALPRDAELDILSIMSALAQATGTDGGGVLKASDLDDRKFRNLAMQWAGFMRAQQSPTREFKLDVVTTPPMGMGMGPGGGPGFGPGGPINPGGGR